MFNGRVSLTASPGATRWLRPIQLHLDRRPGCQRLIDHAIALCELEQLIELVLRGLGFDVKAQPDLRKSDRRIFRNAQCAAEIEISFRKHPTGAQRNVERGRQPP